MKIILVAFLVLLSSTAEMSVHADNDQDQNGSFDGDQCWVKMGHACPNGMDKCPSKFASSLCMIDICADDTDEDCKAILDGGSFTCNGNKVKGGPPGCFGKHSGATNQAEKKPFYALVALVATAAALVGI